MDLNLVQLGIMTPQENQCFVDYLQVIEGEDMDGPVLGKWCSNKIPPPITSTGNALTIHLYVKYGYNDFSAIYSVLNSGES